MVPTRDLNEPVELAARRLALDLLDRALKQLPRLDRPGDAEALHDLRVATRRLRTVLRAYRPFLDRRLGKGLRKELGQVMAATSVGRDLEVQLAWIDAQLTMSHLPASVRQGLERVRGELGSAVPEKAPVEIADGFAQVAERIRRRLLHGARSVRLDASGQAVSYGAATADLVRDLTGRLERELGVLIGPEGKAEVHSVRLTAKKLRYLLEPVRQASPQAGRAVRQLRLLQDLLGDLHDLQILTAVVEQQLDSAARVWGRQLARRAGEGSSLTALSRSDPELEVCRRLAAVLVWLQRRRQRLYGRLRTTLLEDPTATLLAPLAEAADRLRS